MLNNDRMRSNTELGTERVDVILRRCAGGIVEGWLARAKQSSELNVIPLNDEQRAVHVPRLVEDMALRLSKSSDAMKDSDAISSAAAVAHGKLRYLQGYTPAMLVDESRILEVTVFGMLQSNLHSLDFSLLLPDVTAIADEVDGQLTQSIGGYMELVKASSDLFLEKYLDSVPFLLRRKPQFRDSQPTAPSRFGTRTAIVSKRHLTGLSA
jgi:hypothetical protein